MTMTIIAKKFRKKPVEIEAFQFFVHEFQNRLDPIDVPGQPEWMKAAFETAAAWYQGGDQPYLTIKTPEGEMRANPGDWIIRGIKGELYPCKPDIFEATYESA